VLSLLFFFCSLRGERGTHSVFDRNLRGGGGGGEKKKGAGVAKSFFYFKFIRRLLERKKRGKGGGEGKKKTRREKRGGGEKKKDLLLPEFLRLLQSFTVAWSLSTEGEEKEMHERGEGSIALWLSYFFTPFTVPRSTSSAWAGGETKEKRGFQRWAMVVADS